MVQFHSPAASNYKMNNIEDSAHQSILHGNDIFVSKILSSKGDHSSRRGYFSDKQSVVPFIWEEEPGIPKDPPTLDFIVPPIIPPPTKLRPQHGSKPASTQPKSCFFVKPWLRTPKPKKVVKGNQHHDINAQQSFDEQSHLFSEGDLFSLSCFKIFIGILNKRFNIFKINQFCKRDS
ncbi:hypothetical protein SESBI_48003 [Sesbania bispinosa]|nr:hypothetical protein SESBI_48003 [Sesbania bispinosa]